MSRILRKQTTFDQELAQTGHIRSYRREYVVADTGLAPIYREVLISDSPEQFNRTPWWKRKKSSLRQKKS